MKIEWVRQTVFYFFLAVLSSLALSKPTIAVPLLTDDFSGSGLNRSRWTILDGSRGVSVSSGNLILSGSPDHKDVNSIQSFSPGTNTLIEAKARISIGGDYQKFGFGVNSATSPIGFYFDSWDNSLVSNTNTVSAIVYNNAGSQFLNVATPAGWGTYHDLTVQYLPNKVNFLVDNSRVASYSFNGSSPSLPVGVWNDRFPTMLTDKVEVNSASFSDVIRGRVAVNNTRSQMTARACPQLEDYDSLSMWFMRILYCRGAKR